ncbi:MAG TPA: hypothetical protein DCM38_05985 [Gammaproteobacteria bacterium]|nr:hypothetical protein [Gammaproteobacteria bacterium]
MPDKVVKTSSSEDMHRLLSLLNANVVPGGKLNGQAYVVGIVTKRKRSTIPTGQDKKVLINKVTYVVVTPDFRDRILVDYFNPPTTDKTDKDDVPLPDKSKLIPVVEDPTNNPVISVIPVTSTKYGWGFAAEEDKYAGEDF